MPAATTQATFEALYCRAHGCTSSAFHRRVFWASLHRHALVVAPLLLWLRPRYFAADREFVADVSLAQTMDQVRRETRQYFQNPLNRGWLRRMMNVRISAGRLIQLAQKYLPAPNPPEEEEY